MAKPKPTWADYYQAVADQARGNALVRGGGSGPSPLKSLNYGPNAGEIARGSGSGPGPGSSSKSENGGGGRTNMKLYEQPIDWTEPTNVIAHGIAGLSPLFGRNIMDQMADPSSMASGIIDVLSRGIYASQEFQSEYGKQFPSSAGKAMGPSERDRRDLDVQNPLDKLGKVFGAAGRGLTGEKKTTALDLAADQGLNNEGWGAFLRNTSSDVLTDPTTYAGVGLLGRFAKMLKLGGSTPSTLLKGTEGTAGAVRHGTLGTTADLAEEVAYAAKANANPRTVRDFLDSVEDAAPAAAAEAPRIPELHEMPRISPEATATPTVAPPDFAGLMEQLGIKGGNELPVAPVAEEAAQHVPAAGLIAARAKLGQADELAQTIPQRNYAPETAAAIPEEGFWNEVTTKVPVEEAPTPDRVIEQLSPAVGEGVAQKLADEVAQTTRKSPLPTFNYERTQKVQQQHAKVADLNGEDLEGIEGLERTVLEDLNAKVPTEYIENPHFGEGEGFSPEWIPNPKKPGFRTVGELRYIDTHEHEFPKGVVDKARFELSEYQAVHLRHAELHDAVFKTGDTGYLDEIYGKAPEAPAPKAAPKRTTALPPGPLKPVPKYNEIKEFKALDDAEKQAVLTRLDEELGIQPEHVEFLAQADNLKEYKARLEIVKDSMRTSKDIQDVAEGIRSGRITSLTDEGIPEALELFGVKTLKGLASRIEKAVDNLSKQEQKLVDKYFPVDKEGNPLPPKTEPYPSSPAKVKAVTPQGRKVEKMVEEATANARKPATTQVVENATKDVNDPLDIPTNLDQQQVGMYARAVQHAMEEGPIRGNKMPYRAAGGRVAKTEKAAGEGDAVRLDTWNKHTQANSFRSMLKDAQRWFESAKAGGKFKDGKTNFMESNRGRGIQLHARIMPVLKHIDESLRAKGIFPVAGTTNKQAAISMFDVLDAIDTKWVQRNVFETLRRANGKFESTIMPTQIMDAVEIGLAHMVANGGRLPDDIVGLRKMMDKAASLKTSSKSNPMPNHVRSTHKTPEAMDEFMEPIIKALPDLYRRSVENSAAAKAFHDAKVDAGTQTAIGAVAKRLESPTASWKAAMVLSNDWEEAVLKPTIQAHNLNAEDAKAVATNVLAAEQIPAETRGMAKEAEEFVGASKEKQTKMDINRQKAAVEEYAAAMPMEDHLTWMEKSIVGKTIQNFFGHFANKNIASMKNSRVAMDRTVHHAVRKQLVKTAKHGKPALKDAFDAIKIGKAYNVAEHGEAAVAAQKDLNDALMMAGFAEKDGYTVWDTLGLSGEDMKDHLTHFGVPEQYHLDPNKPFFDQYKTWETDDVLGLLDQYTQASVAITTKKLIGRSIMAVDQWASTTPKAGYHKFELPAGSELRKYIDTDNVYYHKDIIREMAVWDRFINQTAKWSKLNHTKVIKGYDEIFHAWKAGNTVYRLGHHARNGLGDMFFNDMAGMTNAGKWYGKAAQLQASMPGSMYDSYGAAGKLLRGEEVAVDMGPKSGETFAYALVGGKKVPLTRFEVMDSGQKRGMRPGYETVEDIGGGPYAGSIRDKINKSTPSINIKGRRYGVTQPLGNKGHEVATKVSEWREHNVRYAQYMWELQKPGTNYKTLEEAMDAAAARTRKWHPDGSDLTPIEQNVLRRTQGFYSWMRKAIPLVLEAMMVKPGRFMVYPKAMYNLAEANGIDLESLSEPFPEEGRYPDWIRDSLQGPIFNWGDEEIGIAPGHPGLDILGDWVNDPGATFVGGAAPPFKVAAELAGGMNSPAIGTDARTGIPTYDVSDYIDKQIPQSSYLAGITGRSPASLFTQPVGGADRTEAQIDKKQDPNRQIINWISGLAYSQLNKGPSQKQAQREAEERTLNLRKKVQKQQSEK